jgi:hypothetical protein
MKKQIIEFPVEGNESIFIEVEVEDEEYGETEVSRPGELAQKSVQTFYDALDKVKPMSEAIISKFKDLSKRPQEINVEFGVKMSAEAGAIIASSGLEANFKITLKWKQE